MKNKIFRNILFVFILLNCLISNGIDDDNNSKNNVNINDKEESNYKENYEKFKDIISHIFCNFKEEKVKKIFTEIEKKINLKKIEKLELDSFDFYKCESLSFDNKDYGIRLDFNLKSFQISLHRINKGYPDFGKTRSFYKSFYIEY